MSIEKNEHVDYSEDIKPGVLQGEFEHKGEAPERVVKASKATLGRHTTSGKAGLSVAKERSESVEANRKASAKIIESHRQKSSTT